MLKRFFFISCGLVFVALAGLGVALPGLPTTPFLLLAAGCFAKSSPYLYNKLVTNRVFGPLIHHWQETRSIPRKAKIISITTIVLMVSISVITLPNIYGKMAVVALVIFPVIFLWRLPNSEDIKSNQDSSNENLK